MKKGMLILVTALMVFANLTACGKKSEMLDTLANDGIRIVCVSVLSGSNGASKSYTNEEDLNKIKEYLPKVRCTPNSNQSLASGWSYRFNIETENGKVTNVVFAGTNSDINGEDYTLQYANLQELVEGLKGDEKAVDN